MGLLDQLFPWLLVGGAALVFSSTARSLLMLVVSVLGTIFSFIVVIGSIIKPFAQRIWEQLLKLSDWLDDL
jgi:hypothetical protein